jgi:hypothetical protein
MLRWTAGRRALTVALVVTLTLLWQLGSSGNRALAILYIVSAFAYVAGAVAASVLMSRWIWRHRAVAVVSGMVAGRFPAGQSWPLRRPLALAPRLWSYRVAGQVSEYAFLMPAGMTLSALNEWREALEQALNRKADWRYQGMLFHLRVIKAEMPAVVAFAELLRQATAQAGELVFCVGMGLMGPVWADLAALPHLLIGGVPGGGKSVFLRQLVTWLALANPPERLRLAFIDLKGGMEMNIFRRLPHRLRPVLRQWQECGSLLEELNGELDRRQAAFDRAEAVSLAEWNRRYPDAALPYLVLVIDEMAELTAVESGDRAEKAARQAQLTHLVRLCRLGRAVGVHAICATQRPDADAVPGQLKANLPATMAFRVRDPVNSRVLLGDGHPEAASLPPIPGRGIWQVDGQVEVQTPWLDRAEASALLSRAYPEVAGVGLRLVEAEDGEEPEPAWRSER